MDISAALTPAEVAVLSEVERSCGDAAHHLGKPGSGVQEDAGLATFQESLRLKNTLDTFEERARFEPSWETLSVLVNCEYRLYILNRSTPLRNNPFLSHWVEAIQRLDAPSTNSFTASHGPPTSSGINTVRVGLIKVLLQSPNPSQLARTTPKQLYRDFVELRQANSFDLKIYVRMLEEEGIYERTPEPPEQPEAQDAAPHENGLRKAKEAARPKLNDFQQWKQSILDKLQDEPNTAIPELTHLPVELSYLDFLTTLLQEKTLQSFMIDPAPVIADYIQHALRLTEQMGQPPNTSNSSGTNRNLEEVINHGREAQTRAVKLLLLFIRNLIRKALIPPEAIYFEIQEICVRYVWIKEVREFRAFIEEGNVGGEQMAG